MLPLTDGGGVFAILGCISGQVVISRLPLMPLPEFSQTRFCSASAKRPLITGLLASAAKKASARAIIDAFRKRLNR
jgi:hypothetical protein